MVVALFLLGFSDFPSGVRPGSEQNSYGVIIVPDYKWHPCPVNPRLQYVVTKDTVTTYQKHQTPIKT